MSLGWEALMLPKSCSLFPPVPATSLGEPNSLYGWISCDTGKKLKALLKVIFFFNWSFPFLFCQSIAEECWVPQILLHPFSHSRFRDRLWLPSPLLSPFPLLSPTRWPPSHISLLTVPRLTGSFTWHTPVSLPVWIESGLRIQTCTGERTPFSHLYCTISDAWREDAKSTAR